MTEIYFLNFSLNPFLVMCKHVFVFCPLQPMMMSFSVIQSWMRIFKSRFHFIYFMLHFQICYRFEWKQLNIWQFKLLYAKAFRISLPFFSMLFSHSNWNRVSGLTYSSHWHTKCISIIICLVDLLERSNTIWFCFELTHTCFALFPIPNNVNSSIQNIFDQTFYGMQFFSWH